MPVFQVPQGTPQNEGLRHVVHFDRGLHAGRHAEVLQAAHQGHAIDHCGQHSHVVGRGAVHAAVGGGQTAPDVAAADDHRELHAQGSHFLDFSGERADDLGRDIIFAPRFAQGLAADFQEHAAVLRRFGHTGRVAERTSWLEAKKR